MARHKNLTKCSIKDCISKSKTNGYCTKHYSNAKNHGEFSKGPCIIDGCEKKSISKGMCRPHYDKQYYKVKPRKPRPIQGVCTIALCGKPGYSKKLCQSHYTRLLRNGTTDLRVINETRKMVRSKKAEKLNKSNFLVDFSEKRNYPIYLNDVNKLISPEKDY